MNFNTLKIGLSGLFEGFGTPLSKPDLSVINVPVDELYKVIFITADEHATNDEKIKQLEDFFKNTRAKIVAQFPQYTPSGQGVEEFDIPQIPTHLENSQLTFGHLQACAEKASGNYIQIDRQILSDFQANSINILAVFSSDGEPLKSAMGRLSSWASKTLQPQEQAAPTAKQPRGLIRQHG